MHITRKAQRAIGSTVKKTFASNKRGLYTLPFSNLRKLHEEDSKQIRQSKSDPKLEIDEKYQYIAMLAEPLRKPEEVFLVPMIAHPQLPENSKGVSSHGFVGHVKMFPILDVYRDIGVNPITVVIDTISENPEKVLSECIVPKNKQAAQDINGFLQEKSKNHFAEFSLLMLDVKQRVPLAESPNGDKYLLEGTPITIGHRLYEYDKKVIIFRGYVKPITKNSHD